MIQMYTTAQRDREQHAILRTLQNGEMSRSQMLAQLKTAFVSDHDVGSPEWKVDVRNYIADRASSVCQLIWYIPPLPHVALQAARARFVVHKYWNKSKCKGLTALQVGGCSSMHAYSTNGDVLFEIEEDVHPLQKEIKDVFSLCGCKGSCSSNRCSCRKRNTKCIGCACAAQLCLNRIGKSDIVQNAAINSDEPASSGSILNASTDLNSEGRGIPDGGLPSLTAGQQSIPMDSDNPSEYEDSEAEDDEDDDSSKFQEREIEMEMDIDELLDEDA